VSVVANVAINVDASKALQQIKGFDSAVSGLGGTAKGLSGQLGELAAKLGIAAGAAVAFNKSFDAIRGMDQAVAKVKTLGVNTDELVPKLAAVSRELKGQVSTAELTAAAYNVASAGFANAADNADILKAASLGAVGGFSDVNTVADAATSILNAYGRSAKDAGLIVDQLVQTQNDGKTTVDEYARALGRIIPTASAAGIGIEQINAGVATLTAKGIQTNEAVTGLNQAISSIIKPTSEAEKMASALGIEFNAAALQSKGLGGVLGDVQRVTGGNVEQMAKLFGSVEALKAVLGLTADDLKVFNKNLENQGAASGVASEAADVMANTIDGAFKRISTAFENMLTETDGIGGSIATILNGLAFVIENLSAAFNLLPGPIRTVVVGFGLLATGITAAAIPISIILPLLKSLSALKIGATIAGWAGSIGPLLAGLGTLGKILIGVFTGPVGWVALAVAAGAAIYAFRDQIGQAFQAVGGILQQAATGFKTGFIDPVVAGFNAVVQFVSNNFVQPVQAAITGLVQMISNTFKNVTQAITAPFQAAFQTVRGIVNSIGRAVSGVAQAVNNTIRGANGALARMGLPQIPTLPMPQIPQFADGGIVTKPTLAIIGEGGEPEYIVPQSKAAGFAANYLSGASGSSAIPSGGGGGVSPTISIQTGPVVQMNGQNYVTTQDMSRAVQAGVQQTLNMMRNDRGTRRAVGLA
jgi:TP901 family phage tail tape measure protein